MNLPISSDMISVLPLLLLSFGAMLVLLVDVFGGTKWIRCAITLVSLAGALVSINNLYINGAYEGARVIFSGQIYVDQYSSFLYGLIISAALLVACLGLDKLSDEKIESPAEYYSLYLISTCGALIFVSAADLVTLFLGLEIMSMALYCLCGSALSIRSSSESALKYFLLGSFSSAFMLYGIALLYGLSGTTQIPEIAVVLSRMDSGILSLALGLVLVGLFFKVGAAPFHFWCPDVYQGAPTVVTAFMASVIKVSAIGVTFRFLWLAFPGHSHIWSGALWVVAVITMTIGNLVALRQRSLKRMLAYSSIAHAGYMLVALLVPGIEGGGGAAILFYLVAYTIVTIGSFGVVLAISSPHTGKGDSDDISRFNSLSTTNPVLAACMALFMLSLAGIPPGLVGLLGKFYVFSSAVKAGYVGIAIIGVLNSAVSAYYYLRVIVAMYFIEPRSGEVLDAPRVPHSVMAVLVVCSVMIMYLGINPSLLHDSADLILRVLGGELRVYQVAALGQ